MKSERIGNDIKIEWSILREGTPFSLSNKDVSIYLGSQFGRTKISGFTIDSNKVIWTFFGKDQKSLGKYSLVLVINEGNEGMITTDICDFVNLVSCSCEVGGTDNEDVQTETIALTSNLEYVASEYYDDTAIWEYIEKMEKAKADKAEIPTRVSQLENDAEYATAGDLGGKQDKINDLDTIRKGAAKGATALQSIPAEYVTDAELDNALRPKVNRHEVATINGQSILNGGNIVIQGGSGGGSYDDTGIKKDISDLKAKDTEQDAELAKLSAEIAGQLFEPGNVDSTGEVANNSVSRTYYIPCNTGDKFSGWIYRIKMFDKNFAYLAEVVPSFDQGYSEGIEITNTSCQYVRIVALNQNVGKGTIKRNGVDVGYLADKDIPLLKKSVEDCTKRLNDALFISGAISSVGEELENTLLKRSPLIPCSKGDVISSYIYRVFLYDENKTFIKQDLLSSSGNNFINYTITEASCKYVRITAYNSKPNEILVNGESLLYCSAMSFASSLANRVFVKGKVSGYSYVNDDSLMSTIMIPFKKGDEIKGELRAYSLFNKDRAFLYGGTFVDAKRLGTDDDNVEYAIVSVLAGRFGVTINGIDIYTYTLNKVVTEGYELHTYPFKNVVLSELTEQGGKNATIIRDIINGAILGVWIKKPVAEVKYYLTAFRYRQVDNEWGGTEYSQITITAKHEDGTLNYLNLLNERITQSVNDELQIFESVDALVYVDWGKVERGTGFAIAANDYLELDAITFKKNNTVYLATLNNGGGASGGTSSNLDNSSYIAMPIPQLAMVNIVSGSLPTSKTADILGTLEFNGMNGNAFTKKIIINAQGNSSLGLAKKNFSIDIMDENYEDSHEIKFGDWVAQDGFHLKSYMLDGIRVKPMAVYDFYESMLLTRGVRKDRAWKRLQLPTDIPMTSNEIADSYLQIDSGAKNHPSGFPVIVFHNGVFYGIYCWQLKKHRANYHQEKKDAAHIHLDGNISNTLLWNANGVIDWGKWSGKTAEADDIENYDGIEIRNPKTLILTDGTEYDGDTNRGELIGKNSASYDSSNKDMKRTAEVRESLENLSRRVYALTQMPKGAEKKSAIAEVFDVDSIIDYIIFGQIVANIDGYKKNWQWVTYDGIKWAVNAYDLDGTWGWSSWSFTNPATTWLHNDTPPVTLIIENYLDEIKARYKELRDKGVIDLAKIMQPLVNYVKVIGIDYYDMEFEKWTDGARDNLWRFESWMEESIKRTDALMGYDS